MKVLLVAVNAKYIHSNLAVYSLQAYAEEKGQKADYVEYTINHQPGDILAGIYKQKPDLAAFSAYIWNISLIDRVAEELKKLLPSCQVWYGGPEVSYNPREQLMAKPYLDGVMVGEGEETFTDLLRFWNKRPKGEKQPDFPGIAFRTLTGDILVTGQRPPLPLDSIPFPYKNLDNLQNRIVYYESSRGCPYSCSYCLSSVEKGVRLRSLDLVKKELLFFINRDVPQVKFIDRTFNCNHAHAMAIWAFIRDHDRGRTNFHFEISADLLREEELALLQTLRPGLVQLEIGVQTIYGDTIRAIGRVMDLDKLKHAVETIGKGENIHQHLDLIAGLPYEDFDHFQQSYDYVYALKPQQLQLGFLKVLKGSPMEKDSRKYGIIYQSQPPFEVLKTRWLSFDEILILRQVEEMTELYVNSGQFVMTLGFLEHFMESVFDFFVRLGDYYEKQGYDQVSHKRVARYEILLEFIKDQYGQFTEICRELLCCDLYLRENLKSRPDFLADMTAKKEERRALFEEEATSHRFLAGYEGCSPGQLSRMVHAEWFAYDLQAAVQKGLVQKKGGWALFDYRKRDKLCHQAAVVYIP